MLILFLWLHQFQTRVVSCFRGFRSVGSEKQVWFLYFGRSMLVLTHRPLNAEVALLFSCVDR